MSWEIELIKSFLSKQIGWMGICLMNIRNIFCLMVTRGRVLTSSQTMPNGGGAWVLVTSFYPKSNGSALNTVRSMHPLFKSSAWCPGTLCYPK